jgi:hypothetical protein
MKTLLLFLAPLLSLAQNPNIPAAIAITGYRGNPIAYTIVGGIPDTTSTLVARGQAYTRQNLPESQWPLVTRRGKDILLSWTGTQSTVLPQSGYLEVIVGGQVRYAGPVLIGREPVVSKPNATTVNAFILGYGDTGVIRASTYQDMLTRLTGRTQPATILVDHDDGPNGLLRDGAYLPRTYYYNGTTLTPNASLQP